MLKKLTIQNFVIAEQLEIDFSRGMCVLTGETGAGKSLIVDAILGVLGQKVPADTIRQGAEFAYLEAVFTPSETVRELLRSQAYDELLESDSLILSKTIHRTGSRSRLNGQLVTQSLIRELSERLIDSIGQHENQALFIEDAHIHMLDELGESSHQALLRKVGQLYTELQTTRRELSQASERQREQERQKDFMDFQLQEISEAALQAGEEEELQAERERLRHAEKLLSSAGEAYAGLYDNPRGSTVCEQLEGVQRLLGAAARFDTALNPIIESLDAALAQMQDAAHELSAYVDGVERNPNRLEEVEDRLTIIKRLRHKYGSDIEAILSFAAELEASLKEFASSEERIGELSLQAETLEKDYLQSAQTLSQARRKLIKALEPRIEQELKELGMAKTRFSVEMEQDAERWAEGGQDKVRFLMSPNPGEPLRPLARIASGGEASRLLLAFKLVLKRANPVPTLIFDEVDTGISGKAALVVSQKLARLAAEHQVLCISHLPVIAAMADQQLWIEKQMGRHETRIQLSQLKPAERVQRLAQMASGQVTDSSLEGAREIYESALAFKSSLDRPALAETAAPQNGTGETTEEAYYGDFPPEAYLMPLELPAAS